MSSASLEQFLEVRFLISMTENPLFTLPYSPHSTWWLSNCLVLILAATADDITTLFYRQQVIQYKIGGHVSFHDPNNPPGPTSDLWEYYV